MDRSELDILDRDALIQRALDMGVPRAKILTRPELIDEIVLRAAKPGDQQVRAARGLFGIARDLLARVVEKGLHLPDAAERLRHLTIPPPPRPSPAAVPTVTLAEIYASQGHVKRAVETLRKVLEREPEHEAARALLSQLEDVSFKAKAPPLPPEPEEEPAPRDDDDEEPAPRDDDDDETAPRDHQAPELRGYVETATRSLESANRNDEPAGPTSTVGQAPAATPSASWDCLAVIMHKRCYVRWSAAGTVGATLRLLIIRPTWDGPQPETRDIALDKASGDRIIADLPERAVVRAAIGTVRDGSFVPKAHSPHYEWDGDKLVRWSPRGREAVSPASIGAALPVSISA